jgi:mRNA interferase MazF
MVSSQLRQLDPDLDWVSVFRLSRIAVLDGSLLIGKLGAIPENQLSSLRHRVADWITGA